MTKGICLMSATTLLKHGIIALNDEQETYFTAGFIFKLLAWVYTHAWYSRQPVLGYAANSNSTFIDFRDFANTVPRKKQSSSIVYK